MSQHTEGRDGRDIGQGKIRKGDAGEEMIRDKVFLVEDYPDTVTILTKLLEKNGYTVASAGSLSGARQALQQFLPDVIILDINLPDGSGLDLLEELRQMNQDVPVIMLTAYSELDNAIRSLQHGVEDFIAKPFDNRYLLHAISRAIEKKRLKERIRTGEKFRVLGELAAGVAHDFNNLLHSMSTHLYLIKKKAQECKHECEGVETHFKALELAISDGTSIVKRLSAMGKAQDDDVQVVDLAGIVNDTILMTKPKWHHEPRKKGRSITVSRDLEDGVYVRVNPSDIREVITNLIFNAVDAMPHGGELVFKVVGDGNRATFSIKDTGIGMGPEVLEKIFDPFFTTKGHGSGLGLSVSCAIIQRNGGHIDVKSEPGKGTIFTIQLPRVDLSGVA